MPRKDPVTGVMVMTQSEFWAAEAEREGKEIHEVLDEWYADLDKAHQEAVAYYSQPEVVLELLQKAANEERACWEDNRSYYQSRGEWFDDPPIPFPVQIFEIVKVTVKDSMRESGYYIEAKCACDCGNYLVKHGSYSWHGSFYEPPDADTSFEFERIP